MRIAVVVALAACSGKPSEPAALGTLAIDGAPTAITACRVVENARNDGVALDLFHARGRLRFTRQHLYATRDRAERDDGSPLVCEKLDRRWGGGLRPDGTGYWSGMLDVRCDRVAGRIELICGAPTAEEQRQLDANAAAARQTPGSALP